MSLPAPLISVRAPSFPGLCPISDAVQALSNADSETRGAIFTRKEVVDFILDLSGYTADRPLHKIRLLEPSFGEGDFLLPAIKRLIESWRKAGEPPPLEALTKSVRAVELHHGSFIATRERVTTVLTESGLTQTVAKQLATDWLVHGDFLLADLSSSFDVVIGNPPYVRQEMIPDVLMAEYRARYKTIYDRADIYIPFIERSLRLLSKGGTLGFICADRWMKNRYGGPLRAMVAAGFHLKTYVDMVDTPAFHSDVIAYPAITIIAREKPGPTRIAVRPQIDANSLRELSTSLRSPAAASVTGLVREMISVTAGNEPWILEPSEEFALVRRLELSFPTLEEAGCKVGIGVATGDDKAFIGKFDDLDVEPDRKLPLVMTKDIDDGIVKWRGFGVINPFAEKGGLVDLDDYPKLKRYLEGRKDTISKRHVAKKIPSNWYRTIDRIYPEIASKPKLLIPDIKGSAHIVYEDEGLYPHHNLYYITSESWDLRALQAVLMSGIARLFVSIYSTKMRGGYLRFQAQYLRRIRVPHWKDVPVKLRKELIAAAERGDVAACNRVVFALYGLNDIERLSVEGAITNAA